MSEAPLPFGQGLASGLSELSGMPPIATNLLTDAAGATRIRPGIALWSDFPADVPNASPIIGMFTWRQWLIYVTEDRKIWAWQAPGSVVALSDTTAATQLDGTGRPIWSYDSARVVVTGGGAPQQWQAVGLSSRLAPAATDPSGSPMTLTHIGYSAQRFIGNNNNNTGVMQWTPPGVGNHTTWPIVGAFFAEAEAAPDPLIALYVNTNEVYTFGTQTTQVYIPDPTVVFTTAASVQVGCSAAYSVIDTDGNFAWLDDRQRLVDSNGRTFNVLSSPLMAADIAAFRVVSDCWGCRIRIASFDLLTWNFPTVGRTIIYDRVTKKFGQFQSTNPDTGAYVAWIPQSFYYWPERNLNLVGLADGSIGTLSFDNATDMGTVIRGLDRTGFQDRGSFNQKICQRAQLQFQRGGTVPPAVAPTVQLRSRDDLGAWRPAIQLSMGAADYQPVVSSSYGQGMYRQRQWELDWSGGSPFLLSGATEQFMQGPM